MWFPISSRMHGLVAQEMHIKQLQPSHATQPLTCMSRMSSKVASERESAVTMEPSYTSSARMRI